MSAIQIMEDVLTTVPTPLALTLVSAGNMPHWGMTDTHVHVLMLDSFKMMQQPPAMVSCKSPVKYFSNYNCDIYTMG